jgi:hypothetical protein
MNGDMIKKDMIDRDTMNMDTIGGDIIKKKDISDGDQLVDGEKNRDGIMVMVCLLV